MPNTCMCRPCNKDIKIALRFLWDICTTGTNELISTLLVPVRQLIVAFFFKKLWHYSIVINRLHKKENNSQVMFPGSLTKNPVGI